MGSGRPPERLRHVDRLEGSREQKQRLRVILETLTGDRSVAEACEMLEVCEARFHELRKQALEGALSGISPGRAGRPRKEEPPPPDLVSELEQEVCDLLEELERAHLRADLALAMPDLMRTVPDQEEKMGAHRAKVRSRNGKKAGR